ncbi:MAG: hypothetical protein LW636_00700 [Planctomycetaceae bacterium]|jgi:hypothetical protein|nr:hypothetical protein [Planctomycetaceae bacterium]
MTSLLAWTPFLQPAPEVDSWWWLLIIPTAVGIALAYTSIRSRTVAAIPREALVMTLQIIAAVVGIAIGLYLLVMVLLPMLPAE